MHGSTIPVQGRRDCGLTLTNAGNLTGGRAWAWVDGDALVTETNDTNNKAFYDWPLYY